MYLLFHRTYDYPDFSILSPINLPETVRMQNANSTEFQHKEILRTIYFFIPKLNISNFEKRNKILKLILHFGNDFSFLNSVTLGDEVEIIAGPEKGNRGLICTLPRNGKRVIQLGAGVGMKMVEVKEAHLRGLRTGKLIFDAKRAPYKYYKPPPNPEEGYQSKDDDRAKKKGSSSRRSSGRKGDTKEEVSSSSSSSFEDPSRLETFRISSEDASSLWVFESKAVVDSANRWRSKKQKEEKKMTNSDDANSRQTSSEVNSSSLPSSSTSSASPASHGRPFGFVGKVDGKDGRSLIADNVVKTFLNHTATILHQRGGEDNVGLSSALSLANLWIVCHKIKEADDLIRTLTPSCVAKKDIRFSLGAMQVMAHMRYKQGDYSTSADLLRQMIARSEKMETCYARENLGYCLLGMCNGKAMVEAEAVFTQAIVGSPGGDTSGVPSPPASALAFAAAANQDVSKALAEINRTRGRKSADGSNIPKKNMAGALLGLGICKYLRGDYEGALASVRTALVQIEQDDEMKEGGMFGKLLDHAAAAAKAASGAGYDSGGDTASSSTEKPKASFVLTSGGASRNYMVFLARAHTWLSLSAKACHKPDVALESKAFALELLSHPIVSELKAATNIRKLLL
eukprot:jgi/Bigna1/136914/aug1.36_g11622